MNNILLENKVKVLERLVLQDIVECYSQQRYSEKSYDDLMAKLLDRLTGFYEKLELDAVSLQRLSQYGDRAKIYTEQLREELDKAAAVTVRQIVKQLPREKLSVATQWDVIQAVRPVLRRRKEVLGSLLSASALQMKNYMLLWDYQDEGFTHYCLLTEGENCDDCNSLEGQIFPISEARVGENFAPMHPNCNCQVGLLDDAGQVAYIISEGKAEKNEEETNWYDAFLRMPQDAKELFLAFANSQNERFGRGDLAGFLDWLTMGIVSGTWQGYQDRYQELLNDPTLYSFVNYLTSGLADTVKGAITPEEPLSLQHWLDSLGTASTAFGVYQMGQNAVANVPRSVTGNADDAAGVVTQETKDVIDDIVIRKDNIRLSLNANKSLKPQELLDELAKSNVKYNPEKVIAVVKTVDDKLLWLEQGNHTSGLVHILERHANDFAVQNITDIPQLLSDILKTSPVKTGSNAKGLFADYVFNENTYRVAYGTNGYIVTFYPID